jgi:hypothetical protein
MKAFYALVFFMGLFVIFIGYSTPSRMQIEQAQAARLAQEEKVNSLKKYKYERYMWDTKIEWHLMQNVLDRLDRIVELLEKRNDSMLPKT